MTVQGLPTFLTSGSHTAGAVRRQVMSQAGDVAGIIDLDDLKIVPAATPNTTVFASGGKAFVKGTTAAASQGFYHVDNQGLSSAITFAAFPAGSFRTDIVVARVQDANIIGGSIPASSSFTIESVSGTNGSATPPAVPADSLLLAQIAIPASTGTLTAGTITDKRVKSQPWNMPWGHPVPSVLISTAATVGVTVLTAGTFASFVAVAGRRYRASFSSTLSYGGTAGDQFDLNFKSDGVAVGELNSLYTHSAGQYEGGSWSHSTEFTLTAGAHVVTLTIGRTAGVTGGVLRGRMWIEDIGPATAQP